jgi:hypothetical protein
MLKIRRHVSAQNQHVLVINVVLLTGINYYIIRVATTVGLFLLSAFVRTDMRRLMPGMRSEKCVVRRFRRCADVI